MTNEQIFWGIIVVISWIQVIRQCQQVQTKPHWEKN